MLILLLLLIPVVVVGLCAISACLVGGRCERCLEDSPTSEFYRLDVPLADEVAVEPVVTAHG